MNFCMFRFGRLSRAAAAMLVSLLGAACTGGDIPDAFSYVSSTDDVRVAYLPGPPSAVFDSALVVLALRPEKELQVDSLALEIMPARGGWCLPVDSVLVRDSEGWFRGQVWMRPTQPGAYVVRWQTHPFTGFTYYLVADLYDGDALGGRHGLDREPGWEIALTCEAAP